VKKAGFFDFYSFLQLLGKKKKLFLLSKSKKQKLQLLVPRPRLCTQVPGQLAVIDLFPYLVVLYQ
jgi:hypothetical protein